jgi:hypothetical protein
MLETRRVVHSERLPELVRAIVDDPCLLYASLMARWLHHTKRTSRLDGFE